MKNNYQQLTETIHVPAGLNDRVRFAARQEAAGVHAFSRQKRGNPFLRTALCAACALALVLGGFSLRPAPANGTETSGGAGGPVPGNVVQGPPAQVLTPTFGLTAYAAMSESTYGPAENGGIAFAIGEGCVTLEFGDFTGCLFQVAGENIAQVRMSIDRGGLYRYQQRDNLTEAQMAEYRQAMADGSLVPAAISQRDDGTWYMPEMSLLGERAEENYDPETLYGFWVSPEDMAWNTGLGITTEAQMDADYFDGAALTVTAVFENGQERTQVYRLHSGELKVEFAEDNTITVLPEPLSPEELRDNHFVYGIYAVPET